MEHGRRLLGALEVAGAALFTAGLALRTAHRRLVAIRQSPTVALQGKIVLIIGSNSNLGKELCIKFIEKGCKVVCSDSTANPTITLPVQATYVCCDPGQSSQVSWLEKKVYSDIGEIDVMVWISKDINRTKTSLDQIADVINKDLMHLVYVMTIFLPNLSTRKGHFIVIEANGSLPRNFRSTGDAVKELADAVAQQTSYNGTVHTMRVTRRFTKRAGDENPLETAGDIVGALETGQTSITLPSATKYIKNTLSFLFGEMQNVWHYTIRHKKLING